MTAAGQGDAAAGAQLLVRTLQRIPVTGPPRALPGLQAVSSFRDGILPVAAYAVRSYFRMVDGKQSSAFVYVRHQPFQVSGSLEAEVNPAVNPPHVGMTVIGGDLLTRHQQQCRAVSLSQFPVMGVGVVVGNCQEFQLAVTSCLDQIDKAAARIAVMRVALQISPVPAGPNCMRSLRYVTAIFSCTLLRCGEPDLNPVICSAW